MGVHNRDYMRGGGGGSGFGGPGVSIPGPRKWSLLTWLIITNIAIFFIRNFVLAAYDNMWGTVSKETLLSGHVYALLTHMFLHDTLFHLLGNMLVLFIFGRILYRSIGPKHFFIIFFGGGILGAILSIGAHWGNSGPMLGASGGVLAVAIATCTMYASQVVTLLIFFVIPARLSFKQIGVLFVVIDSLILGYYLMSGKFFNPTPGEPQIGVIAHLGGMLFGFLYVKRAYQRAASREQRWKQDYSMGQTYDAEIVEEKKESWSEKRRRKKEEKRLKKEKEEPFVSVDVDAILDKISEEGMHSLTPEEKKILDRRSEELAKRASHRR
ncbi:MAG: rhomboid family intramembrane serine protease [Verrucomicrobiales bacterium]|nr:rhomboid family intramembrane serine protease [Verrucomicrobiales bacterium]